MKNLTRENVLKLLNDFDEEAAKKWKYAFAYFHDINEEYADTEEFVFISLERVLDDKPYNSGGAAIRGSQKMGWLKDAHRALKSRQEYGDVGDHSLISEEDARKYVLSMGLDLEDGKNTLIAKFKEVNGYAPILLPADPKFKARRDAACERLGLPAKS